MPESPIFLAKKLCKSFLSPTRNDVLRGIDLQLDAGTSTAIVGESGSGKSTLLHIMGTLDTPTDGHLEYRGLPLGKQSVPELRNREIGFIFQSYNLLSDYSVIENLLMMAKIGREKTHIGSEAYHRAQELLKHVGIGDKINHRPSQLSGGEQQRVAIARALMNSPSLLLADEPTGNLDRDTSQAIQDLLFACAAKAGAALVLVTHSMEFANRCDQVYRLSDGLLVLQNR
ncbi:MAG: Lipoprotein-releasing system ATP-binding protein LolD [Chlamydiia bacterium]|nr:Lipoprotein-releasing system ATP-binding protein LolD [Chlamydiia bacterium]